MEPSPSSRVKAAVGRKKQNTLLLLLLNCAEWCEVWRAPDGHWFNNGTYVIFDCWVLFLLKNASHSFDCVLITVYVVLLLVRYSTLTPNPGHSLYTVVAAPAMALGTTTYHSPELTLLRSDLHIKIRGKE